MVVQLELIVLFVAERCAQGWAAYAPKVEAM